MTDAKKRTGSERKGPEPKAPDQKAAARKAPERKASGRKGAEAKVPEPKVVEQKAVEPKAVEQKPVEQKTAERKPPEPKAPERKAAAEPAVRPAEGPPEPRVPARLKEMYRKEAIPRLRERFRYRNVMEVPRLEKVVVNVRVGDATTDARFLDKAVEELTLIAGQRPVIPRAKKSIAAFKLRKGIPIAAKVTLRGDRMYEFVDKLFNATFPRIKDFKGISERQFDGRGNLNIGVREQLIFPEIDYDKVEKVRGMDITLVTTARTDEEARELLRLLGLPLREAGTGDREQAARPTQKTEET